MEYIRKPTLTACALLLAISFTPSAAASETEGELSVVDCNSGEIDLIKHSDDNYWLSWTQTGTRRSTIEDGPFDQMTGHCTGFLWNDEGHMNGHSACEYVDAAGNKLFVKAQRVGDDASWRFTGGTGEYEGITGSGVFTDFSYFPRLSPTTYQFCPTSVGHYKIPD